MTEVYDLISVGAGGAGLAAAVTTAEAGKKALILDRLGVTGGASVFAKGLFATQSHIQKQEGVETDPDKIFLQHMEYTSYLANARLVRAIIDKSADTIKWLEDRGTIFLGVPPLYPGAPRTWHTTKLEGKGITKGLEATARDLGIPIHFKTRARKLIIEGGKVAGVICDNKAGDTVTYRAKTVVISSGGFANNFDMMRKYTKCGEPTVQMAFGQVGKEGDGVKMAWEAGAAEEGVGVIQRGLAGVVKKKEVLKEAPKKSQFDKHITAILKQPTFWVNANGERFFNESEFSFSHIGNAMSKQPYQILFNMFDDDYRKFMETEGIQVGLGVFAPTGTKIPNVVEALQASIDKDEAWVCDTIEELCVKTGQNLEVLKASMDAYNESCDKGRDALFAKNPEFMKPFRKAPFYAIKGHPTHVGSLGGIKINHRCEVIKKSSETFLDVIPGLYAAGNVAGGMYSDSYDASHTLGLTLAFAYNSGRIAAETALKYIDKN
jgi:fumarate reductase flavoprotein subunit